MFPKSGHAVKRYIKALAVLATTRDQQDGQETLRVPIRLTALDRFHALSPKATDILLAFGAIALSLLSLPYYQKVGPVQGYLPSLLVTIACTATVLVWRKWPALTLTAGMADSWANGDVTLLPLASLGIGLYSSIPERYAGAAMAIYPFIQPPWNHNSPGVGFGVFVGVYAIAFPALAGIFIRRKRELQKHTEQKIKRLKKSIDHTARYAVAEEKTRLAFEIHDGLGHELSVLAIQAGIVQASKMNPDALHAAAAEIPGATQRAVKEMHLILSSLRGDYSPDSSCESETAYRIEFIPTLIGNLQKSGVDVEYLIKGGSRGVPARTSHLIYRVVQEGITNAVKHATGTHIGVTLEFLERRIDISVHNSRPQSTLLDISSGGTGIISLRKRLEKVGGSLDTLHTREGGFLLKAAVPIATPQDIPQNS